jgi:hypothetical protein
LSYFVLFGLQPEPEPEAAAAVYYHYQCPHVRVDLCGIYILPFTAAFCARARARAHNLRYRARASIHPPTLYLSITFSFIEYEPWRQLLPHRPLLQSFPSSHSPTPHTTPPHPLPTHTCSPPLAPRSSPPLSLAASAHRRQFLHALASKAISTHRQPALFPSVLPPPSPSQPPPIGANFFTAELDGKGALRWEKESEVCTDAHPFPSPLRFRPPTHLPTSTYLKALSRASSSSDPYGSHARKAEVSNPYPAQVQK